MNPLDVKALAQMLADLESEWDDMPEIKPGRLYYLAEQLLDSGWCRED